MNVTRIQHPTLPDVQREVPTDEADGWLEAGWVAAGDDAPPEVDTDPVEPDPDAPQQRRTTTKTKEGTK